MVEEKKPLIVELEQVHQCFGIEICDKLKDFKLKWISTIGQDEKTTSSIFEIPSKNLETATKVIKSHKEVVDFQIINRGKNSIQVIIRLKKHMTTAPLLVKSGVAWLSPTWSESQVDRVTMIAPDFKNLKSFITLASENGFEIKVLSKRFLDEKTSLSLESFKTSGFTKLKSASELLTNRQMEVFDLACKHGYYQNPKRVSIEDLSLRLGISESTCAELLRKAERKLLPVLNDIVRVIR